MNVVMVKPSEVWIGERRRKEMGDVQELAIEIKDNGLLHPPTVRPPNDAEKELGVSQRYVLVAGGRRFGAMMALGWNEIPVSVRETMDELKHRIIELNENIKRKQLTMQEEAFMHQEIVQLREAQAALEGKKITKAEIAIELGVSAATLTRSVQAAEAMKKNPHLQKSTSRKAVLRAEKMAEHAERLSANQIRAEQGSKQFQDVQRLVVTADAREWIRTRQPRTIDLVLTDPTWGIDYFSSGQKERSGGKDASLGIAEYDDSPDQAKDFIVDMVPQWFRVLRETGWLMVFMGEEGYQTLADLVSNCCAEHMDYRFGYGEPTPHTTRCKWAVENDVAGKCRWVKPESKPWYWYRPNSRNKPRYPERHAQNVVESILVVNMGMGRLNYPCTNLITCDGEYGEDRIHPNQKPLPLVKELVNRVCGIGDTVMDTSFGSGALLAGAAARAMYVEGCDLNERMRGPALGMIAKYMLPIPGRGKQISEDKYLKMMNRPAVGIDDFTEEEIENEDSESVGIEPTHTGPVVSDQQTTSV